ncbi:hypothetical protein PTSG_09975 [Salpingoeca rosetta]|uniref:Uncharacterized protein n=1 Tax=Salpingoeca rosetta (strain ATCC 50818 / BSB-021) TaxID=946362 RepID=F2UNP8_SALR5|nr:uncharacterized protein PTSG_09975 [Salpingoeca rosetta]EGD79253.1 hypothetical protein PTSG_09975 [Salpingoeca rosetta]|eukprot:XP_004989338.1 hypothetical protein PTSG_09975 [Salpingoeca rosetta]
MEWMNTHGLEPEFYWEDFASTTLETRLKLSSPATSDNTSTGQGKQRWWGDHVEAILDEHSDALSATCDSDDEGDLESLKSQEKGEGKGRHSPQPQHPQQQRLLLFGAKDEHTLLFGAKLSCDASPKAEPRARACAASEDAFNLYVTPRDDGAKSHSVAFDDDGRGCLVLEDALPEATWNHQLHPVTAIIQAAQEDPMPASPTPPTLFPAKPAQHDDSGEQQLRSKYCGHPQPVHDEMELHPILSPERPRVTGANAEVFLQELAGSDDEEGLPPSSPEEAAGNRGFDQQQLKRAFNPGRLAAAVFGKGAAASTSTASKAPSTNTDDSTTENHQPSPPASVTITTTTATTTTATVTAAATATTATTTKGVPGTSPPQPLLEPLPPQSDATKLADIRKSILKDLDEVVVVDSEAHDAHMIGAMGERLAGWSKHQPLRSQVRAMQLALPRHVLHRQCGSLASLHHFLRQVLASLDLQQHTTFDDRIMTWDVLGALTPLTDTGRTAFSTSKQQHRHHSSDRSDDAKLANVYFRRTSSKASDPQQDQEDEGQLPRLLPLNELTVGGHSSMLNSSHAVPSPPRPRPLPSSVHINDEDAGASTDTTATQTSKTTAHNAHSALREPSALAGAGLPSGLEAFMQLRAAAARASSAAEGQEDHGPSTPPAQVLGQGRSTNTAADDDQRPTGTPGLKSPLVPQQAQEQMELKLFASQQLLQNDDLVLALEDKLQVTCVPVGSSRSATSSCDLIVDEACGITIVPPSLFLQAADDVKRVCQQVVHCLKQFQSVHVIIAATTSATTASSSSSAQLKAGLESDNYSKLFLAMLSPWLQPAHTDGYGQATLAYASTPEQFADLCKHIIDQAKAQSPIEADDWMDRTWVDQEPSCQELFLLGCDALHPLSAQSLLLAFTFSEAISADASLIQQRCPQIPEHSIKAFVDACRRGKPTFQLAPNPPQHQYCQLQQEERLQRGFPVQARAPQHDMSVAHPSHPYARMSSLPSLAAQPRMPFGVAQAPASFQDAGYYQQQPQRPTNHTDTQWPRLSHHDNGHDHGHQQQQQHSSYLQHDQRYPEIEPELPPPHDAAWLSPPLPHPHSSDYRHYHEQEQHHQQQRQQQDDVRYQQREQTGIPHGTFTINDGYSGMRQSTAYTSPHHHQQHHHQHQPKRAKPDTPLTYSLPANQRSGQTRLLFNGEPPRAPTTKWF